MLFKADSAFATRAELLLLGGKLVGAFSKRVFNILCSFELNLEVPPVGDGVFLFDLLDDDEDDVDEGE
jgi:hypothetical protein